MCAIEDTANFLMVGTFVDSEHDVSTRHLHMIGDITSSFIGLAELNVVVAQRTPHLSDVGSENHPIKNVAVTIDTSHSHTYTSCKGKVPTNIKFAVKLSLLLFHCIAVFQEISFVSRPRLLCNALIQARYDYTHAPYVI